MPLLYLLQQPVGVDSRDAQGHTSLMWAAYQGDALSVDLLLKHQADPNSVDEMGLTPLHWAVVRANRTIIRKLVEAGGDLNTKDNDGRTPREMAVELKALGAWKRALEEGGMNEFGVSRQRPLGDRATRVAIFSVPTVFLGCIFATLAVLPWYSGLVVAGGLFFGMHHIVTRVLLNKSRYTDSVNTTPYFAGIIFGSVLWVVYCWASRLMPHTPHAPTHLAFALVTGLCVYNFFRAVTLDPGTCPKPSSPAELRTIIEDLAASGRLNGQTFCIPCLSRKALRSKHCRICDKCVARHDHHCPWIWNCVGVGNHRQFVLFVTALVGGISLFNWLVWDYLSELDLSTSTSLSPSCPLPETYCSYTSHSPFLIAVTGWATLQLSWTILLLASQLWQIARQLTTLEVSNLGRYGFMGGRGGASLNGQMGHRHGGGEISLLLLLVPFFSFDPLTDLLSGQHGALPSARGALEDTALVGSSSSQQSVDAHGHNHDTPHSHKGICANLWGGLLTLTGFDRFTKGKVVDGMGRAGRGNNVFDLGLSTNCMDFWTRGRALGVEYETLYDVPEEGFAARAANRKDLDDRDRDDDHPKPASSRSSIFMGLRSGFGSARAGYEPVSQV
ncbi:ankyrin [Mycena floridula]|nr:ankyrin [Mycena floridula]